MYVGQPLFSDVDKFMQEMGFELWALKNQYNLFDNRGNTDFRNRHNQLIFADAIYFKKRNVFLDNVNHIEDESLKNSTIKKYLIISLLFGYFQLSLEIIDLFPTTFTPNQASCFRSCISELISIRDSELIGNRFVFIKKTIEKLKRMLKWKR